MPSLSNSLSITNQAGSGISQQNEQQQLAEIKYDMFVTFAYYWEFTNGLSAYYKHLLSILFVLILYPMIQSTDHIYVYAMRNKLPWHI